MTRKLIIEITDNGECVNMSTTEHGEFTPIEVLGFIELLKQSTLKKNFNRNKKKKPKTDQP